MQNIEERLGSLFKKNSNIDESVRAGSSTVLNQRIEFQAASKPQSAVNDVLKDKYINLTASQKCIQNGRLTIKYFSYSALNKGTSRYITGMSKLWEKHQHFESRTVLKSRIWREFQSGLFSSQNKTMHEGFGALIQSMSYNVQVLHVL